MITLKAELFQDLNGTVKGLQSALQNAIELEHATIPPYLYALYSIRQNTNAKSPVSSNPSWSRRCCTWQSTATSSTGC